MGVWCPHELRTTLTPPMLGPHLLICKVLEDTCSVSLTAPQWSTFRQGPYHWAQSIEGWTQRHANETNFLMEGFPRALKMLLSMCKREH